MPKYMVVVLTDDGETFANFFDDVVKAENCRQNSECGMGWYAEVYERVEGEFGREYKLAWC